MQWCCFLFWFIYRLVLACLAHFNWVLAFFYANCAYFWMWKSYDLLWFWMHLVLCTCFPQLRRENYLLVWCNLLYKRCTQYPHLTFKQLYLALYGGKGTKAERALQRMDTIEHRERESRRLRKLSGGSTSSDEEDSDETQITPTSSSRMNGMSPSMNKVIEEEEEECRKYVYVGEAVDSNADLEAQATGSSIPIPPPRKGRISPAPPIPEAEAVDQPADLPGPSVPQVTFNVDDTPGEADADEGSGNESDTNSTSKWIQKVPNIIRNKFRKSNTSAVSQTSTQVSLDNGNGDTNSLLMKIRKAIPNPLKSFNRSASQDDANPNELDILRPNYTNTYDIKDPKERQKRERRDKRALTTRVRKRLREELREAARIERQRRLVTDSIELLLQLLRMMASFAILIGNIRKTFIPAQFKYLRPGQHAYDNYELLLLFRVTCFIDVAMFWMNVMWVWCLQWHLCCRLGFMRFWGWAILLAVVATVTMLMPMSYAMNQMDLSWCHFLPNSTLERYQPNW